MANNSRVSQSASIEDLSEKNVQMEAELSKMASEMQEVLKRQAESSRKQEENQLRMEEVSRSLEDKIGIMSLMMERTMRQLSGKAPNFVSGDSSNPNGRNRHNGDGHSRNQENGTEIRGEEEGVDHAFNMNDEEYEWAAGCRRNRERVNRSLEGEMGIYNCQG